MRAFAFAMIVVALLACRFACAALAADVNVFDGKVHLTLTPYVWVPTINGTLGFRLSDFDAALPQSDTGNVSLDIAPGRYLKDLTSLAFIDAEIRRGRFAFLTDYVNFNLNANHPQSLDLSNIAQTPLVLSGTLGLHVLPQFITFGPSFTVMHTRAIVMNVLLGGRVALISARTFFQFSGDGGAVSLNGSFAKSGTFSDAIAGVYGHVDLAKHLSIPYYVDSGTGTPSFTWQGSAGIRYGQLSLSYRHLSYAGGATLLLQSLRLDGPELGYRFEF